MPTTTHTLRLDDLELFADCTKSELRQIDALTTHLRIPKGQVLIHQGDVAMEFIVLCSGAARVTRETEQGVEVLADIRPGDFLGEMALLGGTRRTATVTAVTDLDILVSSVGEFRTILDIAPSVARKVRRASLVRASMQTAEAA